MHNVHARRASQDRLWTRRPKRVLRLFKQKAVKFGDKLTIGGSAPIYGAVRQGVKAQEKPLSALKSLGARIGFPKQHMADIEMATRKAAREAQLHPAIQGVQLVGPSKGDFASNFGVTGISNEVRKPLEAVVKGHELAERRSILRDPRALNASSLVHRHADTTIPWQENNMLATLPTNVKEEAGDVMRFGREKEIGLMQPYLQGRQYGEQRVSRHFIRNASKGINKDLEEAMRAGLAAHRAAAAQEVPPGEITFE